MSFSPVCLPSEFSNSSIGAGGTLSPASFITEYFKWLVSKPQTF